MPASALTNNVQGNQYYIGAVKQSAWDTGASPTWFYRFLKGSDVNLEPKIANEYEGDTGPWMNLVYKEEEHVGIKIVEYARPQLTGYALQALLGTSSDTYTAPTKNTTLAAAITAGATTFQSTADLGNASTLYINFDPGYSNSKYEVQNVNLASRTGAGPYTYTLASSATFTYGHSNGATITSAATHTFTRQNTTYDPYCFEDGFTTTGIGKAFRSLNCVCTELVVTAEAKKPIKLEHTWYGTSRSVLAALSSPTYEGNGVVNTPGAPFHFRHASGNWTLDGGTTLNALAFDKLVLTIKNSTQVDDILGENLNPQGFLPGVITIKGESQIIFQSYAQYLNTYFGSSSAGTGTSDATLVGTGSLNVNFAADGINSLTFNLPKLVYTAAKLVPDDQAKALRQPIVFEAFRDVAATVPFTATLVNSLASQY